MGFFCNDLRSFNIFTSPILRPRVESYSGFEEFTKKKNTLKNQHFIQGVSF